MSIIQTSHLISVMKMNAGLPISNVATVLVQKGTLTSGTSIVAGTTWAKVRQMQDSSGRPLKSAGPGTPVSLTGWKDLPTAGDVLLQAPTEDDAKRAISNRLRDIERRKMLADVEQINEKRAAQRLRAEADEKKLEQMKAEGRSDAEVAAFMREVERRDAKGEAAPGLGGADATAEGAAGGGGAGGAGEEGKKWLNLVIKADVSGTVEAVVGSLESIGNKEAGVKIVGTGVGEVGESDVNMAEATGGMSYFAHHNQKAAVSLSCFLFSLEPPTAPPSVPHRHSADEQPPS